MRIGLFRHFPVDQPVPRGFRKASDLAEWKRRYDDAVPVVRSVELGEAGWEHCLTSDLPRAVTTAEAVYRGTIEQTPLLREGEFAEFATGDLRLPVWAWKWILRLSWATGHRSQRACRDDLRRRVLAAADRLEATRGDVLVVSHAGFLSFLARELVRRGFDGPRLRVPDHARLYVFRRGGSDRQDVRSA
jgi:broad specificity phosphatase PhoE